MGKKKEQTNKQIMTERRERKDRKRNRRNKIIKYTVSTSEGCMAEVIINDTPTSMLKYLLRQAQIFELFIHISQENLYALKRNYVVMKYTCRLINSGGRRLRLVIILNKRVRQSSRVFGRPLLIVR
jgi:hypothetical protein